VENKMKKFIFLLLIPFYLFAQKPHASFMIQEADSSNKVYWQIKGTEIDTSNWYQSHENMSIYWWVADTTGSDSVDLNFSFQTVNSEKDIPATERTMSVTTDSSSGVWKLTQIAIGNGQYWRLIIDGDMGTNTNLAGSLVKLRYDGYPNVSR